MSCPQSLIENLWFMVPPYVVKKIAFIDELHTVLAGWQGPCLLGRDFNLSRFPSDKSNGRINKKIQIGLMIG
jgi:hypothetical protein